MLFLDFISNSLENRVYCAPNVESEPIPFVKKSKLHLLMLSLDEIRPVLV